MEKKLISFLIDGKGSNVSCDRLGIKKYFVSDDGTNKINPFYCNMPFYTYPLLQFKNIEKESLLDKKENLLDEQLKLVNNKKFSAQEVFDLNKKYDLKDN